MMIIMVFTSMFIAVDFKRRCRISTLDKFGSIYFAHLSGFFRFRILDLTPYLRIPLSPIGILN